MCVLAETNGTGMVIRFDRDSITRAGRRISIRIPPPPKIYILYLSGLLARFDIYIFLLMAEDKSVAKLYIRAARRIARLNLL